MKNTTLILCILSLLVLHTACRSKATTEEFNSDYSESDENDNSTSDEKIDLGQSDIPQTYMLVDFGGSAQDNIYGIEEWNTVITGSGVAYVTQKEITGVTLTTETEKFASHVGMTGPALKLDAGDMVVAYWHNATNGMVTLWRPLISFVDIDQPEDKEGAPQWYAMKTFDGPTRFDYIHDGRPMKSVYVITSTETAPGNSPPTEGWRSVINFNQNSTFAGIILDKVEIIKAAQCKPSAPSNLNLTLNAANPTSSVKLAWTASVGDPPVKYYKIIRNGLWIDKTLETQYTDWHLNHSTQYTYTITAINTVGISSEKSGEAAITTAVFSSAKLINPQHDLEYLGAFRFPTQTMGASGWAYRLGDLTYYPDGEGGAFGPGAADGYPGTLFAYGHIHQRMIAEISIPEPIIADSYEELPAAVHIQPFADVIPDNNPGSSDKASPGLEYLESNDLFFTIFGDNYNVSYNKKLSHGAFKMNPNLANAFVYGLWWIGNKEDSDNPNYYAYAHFLFEIPQAWSDTHTPGKQIASGASRAGGGPQGPGLVAVQTNEQPAPDAELGFTTLLQYDLNGKGPVTMNGWIENDAWTGGAWLEAGSRSAVVFVGSKARGEYFYGYADGTVYTDVIDNIPPNTSSSDVGSKGGGARSYESMMIFYNPDDLASVANGSLTSTAPQPYAAIVLDDYLLKKNTYSPDTKALLGETAYDREGNLLFVIENNVAVPKVDIIHVWKIK
ncbi:MAG: fibronectin type III domain-containing protein [Deltaproteobacteria bacterium]|nr:fibronectin type III domain-containing protein [Deltaproteobacteria bacterium]